MLFEVEKIRVLVKMNRRKLGSNISMTVLLVGLIAFIFMNKESNIKDFPVLMSVIHINDDKEEEYKYMSVMLITLVSGAEGKAGILLVLKSGKKGKDITLPRRNYVLYI
ncbi:hypothetical protein ABH61_24940 [Bacillus paranthracis]|nr:hypothetical protein [Bacillus paranthracis]